MIRTGYSFKTAVGHLPEVIARLKECGWQRAPIADRNSTFGFTRWTKLCKSNDLVPVYGVEIGVTPMLGQRLPVLDYWTFLAKDKISAINELVALATSNPGKEPSLTYAQAIALEGVFKISGERTLLEYMAEQNMTPKRCKDFFIGLSPATPRGLYKQAKAAGFKFCAMENNIFPRPEDREFYRVTMGKRQHTQTYPQYIMPEGEWCNAVDHLAHPRDQMLALQNRSKILKACNAEMKKATLLKPAKPMTLRAMCERGAKQLGIDLKDKVYAARLKRELDVIEEKKFEDYFFIIADMVQWARKRMVVGPGRGSSSGSLVCYLLGITAIDPIPYGLLFERFLDLTRTDLPDVDIDFSDAQRHLVFKYAEEKYGEDRVARLGTVGMFKPRSALNQAGIALRIPRWQIDKVLDSLILRSSGDSRAMQQLEDTLNDTEAGRALLETNPEIVIAGRMEGHPNNASQHAAGIIITEEPVTEYVALDRRSNSAMCDKKDAEELTLLKIDALGLTQLSIFERTLELIGQQPVSGWLEKIPLNDQAAFDVLNRGHFSGIFQFMGRALKNLVKQSGIKSFDDMVAITALARPGPMGTGGAGAWARRRAGLEKVTYPHPLLKPYLEETLGVVTMQEQVMRIGRELGDLTWKDVTALRKAMSKSLGTEYFDQFGDRWKAAVIAKGMPAEIANVFWKDLCAFGLWGFNKSHAVAYAIVSYWCCWLKAHHPFEFAAATLDAEADTQRQIELLRELADEGIQYVPFDAAHSTDKWEPVTRGNERILVGPLTNIKGIGPATVAEILECRRTGKDLKPSVKKRLAEGQTAIDTLFPVRDRVRTLHPDLSLLNILSDPTPINKVQCGVRGDVMVIAVVNKIAPRDENEAVNVAKRGGRVYRDGKTKSLNMFFKDDTDEIFCKIDRFAFDAMGNEIIERGRPGRAIYAIKGSVPPDFRMIKVKRIKYLGDLDESINKAEQGGRENNGSTNTGLDGE